MPVDKCILEFIMDALESSRGLSRTELDALLQMYSWADITDGLETYFSYRPCPRLL